MRHHQSLFERVREHELMAEKFHQIEVALLSTLDYRTFFETLMNQVQQAFDIPYVWFTLIRDTEFCTLLTRSGALSGLGERLVRIPPEAFAARIGDSEQPLLINEEIGHWRDLFPQGHTRGVGSLSVIPIRVDGVLIGSLNQADTDPRRYRPGLSTVFLERLAVKLELGLSNVTAHEKLKHMAYHDPLTQLLNRRVMETILEREMNRVLRYSGVLAVAFIDLDAFKQVNDAYGHDVGDRLLQYVADGIKKLVRKPDVVTRYAGDEFVVILPETTADNARRLMERIQATFLARPLVLDDLTLPVRLSAGVASTEEASLTTVDALLRQADQALYREKQRDVRFEARG